MQDNTVHVSARAAAYYADGELVVAPDGGVPEQHVREDEIVVIMRTLDDGPAIYRLVWLRETADGTEAPFRLETVLLAGAAVDRLPHHLLDRHRLQAIPPVFQSGSQALHVVVSTRSGVGQAQTFYSAVLAPLLGHFGLSAATTAQTKSRTFHLLVTSNSRSVSDFARTLGPDAPTVILLSGDGGVVDLLNGVAVDTSSPQDRRLPTIALLPLGTGNALFHSLHRSPTSASTSSASSLVLGLRTLLHGQTARLPNFEASFAPGSHAVSYSGNENTERIEPVARLRGAIVASYGFHAQLVWESDTPAYRRHGAKRFGMAAQELLKTAHVYMADVETTTPASADAYNPRQTLGHRFSYVLATMVSNLEKTFTISPASWPLDGQLRLVHFGAVGGTRTMDIMMAAYNNGAHVGMRWPAAEGDDAAEEEAVGYGAIDELRITVHEPDARWRKMYVPLSPVSNALLTQHRCIDGTIVELPQNGWMHVRKATRPVLQIMVEKEQWISHKTTKE
ncbi:cortical actin cytoskeleton protein vip1 [Grosmannia clavigera kw1407]|uniref:Cortical actin cytoskeleton protein vip1 n=1 Tax=Grosmannia clavigera (strain kw1407 / UAMH 11150) TaxID=655863 RepID=F0X958_GROCL|nr:cortical actin cytoskeleton protein vip1 [Grosmannia clavigera kw1407]EFX06175.1 cortical actin cytoskeleton protein vip1 [Grosmannia clavigera kw1407]